MADHPEVDLDVIPTWGLASASTAQVGPRTDVRSCINRYHHMLKSSARNTQEIEDESLKIHENMIRQASLQAPLAKAIFEANDDDPITLFIPNDAAYGKFDKAKLEDFMKSKVILPTPPPEGLINLIGTGSLCCSTHCP